MSFENKYVSSSEMMKSNVFAQTCNKLSRLLKQNRSFTHHHMFSSSGNSMKNIFSKNKEKKDDIKSLDLFPLMSSSAVVNTDDESTQNDHTANHKEVAITKEDANTKTASMTIFYGGNVLVFDDLSEEKAREIMSLASLGAIQTQTQTQNQISTHPIVETPMEQPSHSPILIDQSDSSSDLLPIARRVSLHRFMEKRKNRIAASAPYPSQRTSRENIDEKYKMMMGQRLEKELELKLFK